MTVQLTGPYDGVVTLNPGLVDGVTSQALHFVANLGTKQSLTTPLLSQTGITYTGATTTCTGSGGFGCTTTAPGSGNGTIQVQWFTGPVQADTSTIDIAVQTFGLAGTIVTGLVHGGQLDGATLTGVINGATPTGTPVTSVHYVGTVTFLK